MRHRAHLHPLRRPASTPSRLTFTPLVERALHAHPARAPATHDACFLGFDPRGHTTEITANAAITLNQRKEAIKRNIVDRQNGYSDGFDLRTLMSGKNTS